MEQQPSAVRPPRAQIAVLAVAIVALLAASGTVAARRVSQQLEPGLERLVPASAVGMLSVSLRPSGAQRAALDDLLDAMPSESRDRIGDGIAGLLDQALKPVGLRWKQDVEPWVGAQVVVAALDEKEPVALIAIRDAEAAEAALGRATAEGGVFGVAGNVATVAKDRATLDAFTAASAKGPPVTEGDAYAKARAEVGDDLLAFGFLDTAAIDLPAGFATQAPRGVAALGVRASAEALVVEMTGDAPLKPANAGFDLLGGSPADALAAFGSVDIASMVEQALDTLPGAEARAEASKAVADLGLDLEDDLLPWLHGEVSVLVGGFTVPPIPDVAVLVEPTDEAALGRTMSAAQKYLTAEGMTVAARDGGFDVQVEGTTVVVRRAPGRLVVASSAAYAGRLLTASDDRLDEDAVYRAAVEADGATGVFYLRIEKIRTLLGLLLPGDAGLRYREDVDPLIAPFAAIGVSQRVTDGRTRAVVRLVPAR